MKKCYLIVPHSSAFLQSERVFPAVGAMAIKSFLEANEYKCWLEDEWNESKIEEVSEYDYICFSSTTAQWRASGRQIAAILKQRYPNKKIIVGGAAATYHYEELDKDTNIDFIVMESGERIILDILEKNVTKRIVNAGRLTTNEFNKLPLPWRSKDYLEKYQYKILERRATSTVLGLFCPMGCA